MNGTEVENVWFSHQFSRSVGDDELRRKLAYIRKSEQQQQKILTHLKPADESALELSLIHILKMRGKNGCMAYREGERIKSRAKLGFAVKDIIDNMPGAFIVYRADKENDEILLANNELLRLTGCKNMDELLAYTGKSFCNLIRPDEQENCQKSIWSQINGGHSNDYIFFHMKKADGTYISVLDHDRIVDSVHNGRVFYVMIMDLKSLQRHYGDCLELVEK